MGSGTAKAAAVLGCLSILLSFLLVPSLVLGTLAIVNAGRVAREHADGSASDVSMRVAKLGKVCAVIGIAIVVTLLAMALIGMIVGPASQ